MNLINADLMRHPSNWFTIILMVLISGVAIHVVLQYHSNVAVPS